MSMVRGGAMYVVAPTGATIVHADDQYRKIAGDEGSYRLGSIVTLRLDEKTAAGDDIYLTFAHLKHDSVPDTLQSGSEVRVKAGQILGEVGGCVHKVSF